MSIYSQEALEARRHKTKGTLLPRVDSNNSKMIAYVLLALALSTILLIVSLRLPHISTIAGVVEANHYTVITSSGGTVYRVSVKIGDQVDVGQELLVIRKSEDRNLTSSYEDIDNYYTLKEKKLKADFAEKLAEEEVKASTADASMKNIEGMRGIMSYEKRLLKNLVTQKEELLTRVRGLDLLSRKEILDAEHDLDTLKLKLTEVRKSELEKESLRKEHSIVASTWNQRKEQILATAAYELEQLKREKIRDLDEHFTVIKSQIKGKVTFLPYQLNDFIKSNQTLAQIEPQDLTPVLLFKTNEPFTQQELNESSFEVKFQTLNGPSKTFAVKPFELQRLAAQAQRDDAQAFILKFTPPAATVEVGGEIFPIRHGLESQLVIKREKATLLSRLLTLLKNSYRGFIHSVF